MKKLCLLCIVTCLFLGLMYGDMSLAYNTQQNSGTANYQLINENKVLFESNRTKANAGDLEALFNVGVMYIFGQGVGMNLTEGYNLVREAAEKGFPAAQNWMGDFYADSRSAANIAQAIDWWNKAAIQGDPNAQLSMGQCFEQGLGMEQNYQSAVYWYLKAADQNVNDAKIALSNCYREGKGVKKDIKEALFWMLVSNPGHWNQGNPNIDNLVKALKDSEVKKIKKRAVQWFEEHKA